MKQILIAVGLVFATGVASADPYCSISRSTKGDSTFDQNLYSEPLTGATYVVVRDKDAKAERIDFDKVQTPEQWQALNGETIVTFSAQPDGQYGMTVGKVDLSQTENALPLDAIVVGTMTNQKPLSLMLFQKKLSMSCFQMP